MGLGHGGGQNTVFSQGGGEYAGGGVGMPSLPGRGQELKMTMTMTMVEPPHTLLMSKKQGGWQGIR